MTNFRLAGLLIVAGFVFSGPNAFIAPATAQTLKYEPAADQLPCGKKVLVENRTCPTGEILEVTGSCLVSASGVVDMTQKGRQLNCIKRK